MKKYFRLYIAILAFAIVNTSISFAATPSGCIDLDTGGRGVALRNTCNKKLLVHYCVDNKSSSFYCYQDGRFHSRGSKTLSPGHEERIPEYIDEGGGRVYWAACVYPDIPSNWTGPSSKFVCR